MLVSQNKAKCPRCGTTHYFYPQCLCLDCRQDEANKRALLKSADWSRA